MVRSPEPRIAASHARCSIEVVAAGSGTSVMNRSGRVRRVGLNASSFRACPPSRSGSPPRCRPAGSSPGRSHGLLWIDSRRWPQPRSSCSAFARACGVGDRELAQPGRSAARNSSARRERSPTRRAARCDPPATHELSSRAASGLSAARADDHLDSGPVAWYLVDACGERPTRRQPASRAEVIPLVLQAHASARFEPSEAFDARPRRVGSRGAHPGCRAGVREPRRRSDAGAGATPGGTSGPPRCGRGRGSSGRAPGRRRRHPGPRCPPAPAAAVSITRTQRRPGHRGHVEVQVLPLEVEDDVDVDVVRLVVVLAGAREPAQRERQDA